MGSASTAYSLLGSNAGNVSNSGEIYGSNAGVLVNTSITVGASISNSGEIRSDNHGIRLANSLGGAPVIVNSGTIIGRTNAIFATSATGSTSSTQGSLNGNVRGDSADQADSVTNNKTILGNVFLGSGNDSYKGIGTVSGTVFGEAGNDSLSGGNAIDRLDGGLGNDTLTGNAGNDVLDGGDGNDRLFGGLGNDNLTGGGNNDIFVFNTALNSSTNRDIVTDFNHVADTFWLENAIMTKLGAGVHALSPLFFRAGAAALDANDYIVYNRRPACSSTTPTAMRPAAPSPSPRSAPVRRWRPMISWWSSCRCQSPNGRWPAPVR